MRMRRHWDSIPAWCAISTTAWGADLRRIVEAHGGHATLVRGPFETRHQMPVFHPATDAVAALSRRVKENFDPNGVLNPGRMVEAV